MMPFIVILGGIEVRHVGTGGDFRGSIYGLLDLGFSSARLPYIAAAALGAGETRDNAPQVFNTSLRIFADLVVAVLWSGASPTAFSHLSFANRKNGPYLLETHLLGGVTWALSFQIKD